MASNAEEGVKAGELYTLRQFMRRMGIAEAGMRQLKRAGLPVQKFGKRVYVSGTKVVAFFEGLGDGAASKGR